jgi:hypothetical protein
MAKDLIRQKKERVPKSPLSIRILVRIPLRDIPREERMGHRMKPPRKKRTKAIWVGENEEERYLIKISVKEKMIAARSISPKPLISNRLRIILIVSVR